MGLTATRIFPNLPSKNELTVFLTLKRDRYFNVEETYSVLKFREVKLLRIALGSDHGGFILKEEIKDYLTQKKLDFHDFGTYYAASVDYPDFALKVAEAIAQGNYDRGILVCGTGIGIGIAANKVPGIRAALCHDTFSARASREHNDANVLTLGERIIGRGLALEIVETWLKTEFSGGRHQRRVDKIGNIEQKYLQGDFQVRRGD